MFSPGFQIHQSSDPLVKDFYAIIQHIGKPMSVKRGQVIIRQGTHPSFFFYVNEGICKTSIQVRDKEFIFGFTFPGDVDGCPVSLLSKQPNNFCIESVIKGEILICELSDFYRHCTTIEYHTQINAILIHYLQVVEKRVVDAISLTAEERYKLLLEQQPVQVEQIPLTYIAAYLGITLESLSRIRQKLKI